MQDLEVLKTTLVNAKSTLILMPQNPPVDTVAASLGLYISLQEAGKDVVVASSTPALVRDSHIVGIDQVRDSIGNANLVISFPYVEDSIEKVSYNVEGDRFHLVVQPKRGFKAIDKDSLAFAYTGANADAVVVVGARSLEQVGPILTEEKDLLDNATLINISNIGGNFGKLNFVDPAASVSEITTALIQEVALPLSEDAANNLLQGIEDYTDNLSSPNVTADTFEALAVLYRAGARRRPLEEPPAPRGKPNEPSRPPAGAPRDQKPRTDKPAEEASKDEPSPDWLRPKIMRSSGSKS